MTIGQSMIPEFDAEMASTRSVLERVPNDKLDWKIHEKSNTIGWVANHLADIPSWVESSLAHDSFDIDPEGGPAYQTPNERSRDAIIELFDRNIATARPLIEGVEDARLMQDWHLLQRGKVLMTMPRIAVLRTWVLNHSIHHRAHLCVYFRVNDIPVPGLYGPSADDAS